MPDCDNFGSIPCARPYRDRLKYWAVVRLLPNMQRITVARFRSRSDADGHQQFLTHQLPNARFLVMFDLREG